MSFSVPHLAMLSPLEQQLPNERERRIKTCIFRFFCKTTASDFLQLSSCLLVQRESSQPWPNKLLTSACCFISLQNPLKRLMGISACLVCPVLWSCGVVLVARSVMGGWIQRTWTPPCDTRASHTTTTTRTRSS